ncbi:NAD-binding protein [Fomitopsis schrenkii]|uniref:NAD-binding protein n=1 Tax=Fomitopsis schrenkii TaxID=2126942 RepID=S8G2H1_FOMSC|nr:NAD-binding protein [Fomitopsis schrenkii]
MPSYLVTGASRGIGLGLVKELVTQIPANFVVAAVRNPDSSSIKELQGAYHNDRFAVVTIDYSDYASIEQAAEEAAKILPNGLDYLISNAAISLQENVPFEQIDLKAFEEELRVNTVAPIEVVRSFLPVVREGTAKKIVFVSSILASLDFAPNVATLSVTYAITKVGLNMLARKQGAALYEEGITVVALHPGWVETDMGLTIRDWWAKHDPDLKPITVQQSVEDVLKVITQAKPQAKIPLYNHTGEELSW